MECQKNSFGDAFDSNTLGNECVFNAFGFACTSNTLGAECNRNNFGINCVLNVFGTGCYSNTFRNYCSGNAFGSSCYKNIFGNGCAYNTFGNGCGCNTFGSDCSYIKFGSSSSVTPSTAKSYCRYVNISGGNQNIVLDATGTTSASNFYQNVDIKPGVNNTSTYKTITDPNVGQTYTTTYQPANSQVIAV